jgi:hypothetical protein
MCGIVSWAAVFWRAFNPVDWAYQASQNVYWYNDCQHELSRGRVVVKCVGVRTRGRDCAEVCICGTAVAATSAIIGSAWQQRLPPKLDRNAAQRPKRRLVTYKLMADVHGQATSSSSSTEIYSQACEVLGLKCERGQVCLLSKESTTLPRDVKYMGRRL